MLANPATDVRRPILGLDAAALGAWLKEQGLPAHHGRQLRRWLIVGRAEAFHAMTDLPKALRQKLEEEFTPFSTTISCHQKAADGTHKLLLRLEDGHHVECVLLQEEDRRTVCISTQVGCGMGCVFCASGLNGVVRNLQSHEILEQFIRLRNLLPPDERLTHVVVMGMGEPLANLDNLLEALEIVGAKDGMDVGARHITISTVGLPAKIRRLADLGKQYHLAVSLHAPNDVLRTQIVPTNEKVGLTDILAASDYFFQKTKRQVTFEYVLLSGVNDRPGDARALARLLRGRHAHVNLIPFNEVEGLPYRMPSPADLRTFIDVLERAGLSVKVRKRKGSEIDAACGQLRRRVEAAPSTASGTSLALHGLTE